MPPKPKGQPTIKSYPQDKEDTSECIALIKTFQKGGTPGLARLKQVLSNIFKHTRITDFDKQITILMELGLSPYIHKGTRCHVTFKLDFDFE